MEIEAIRNPGYGQPREKTRTTNANITNRMQEMKVRMSGTEYVIEESDT